MNDLVKESLSNLVVVTNRSFGQTVFLFELCDNDLSKLLSLEERITNNYVGYCPSDKEELEKVLLLPNNNRVLLSLDEFRVVGSKSHNTCVTYRNELGTIYTSYSVPFDLNRTDYFWEKTYYTSSKRERHYQYKVEEGTYKGVKVRFENGKRVLPLSIYDK